jgi:hypothetical protein
MGSLGSTDICGMPPPTAGPVLVSSPRLLARRHRRSRLAHRDRGRTGRQALPAALGPAPRRQPRAVRPRRRPAADPAPDPRRLIHSKNSQCSATASPQRPFAFAINDLVFPTVEDQLDEKSALHFGKVRRNLAIFGRRLSSMAKVGTTRSKLP